MTPEQIYAMSAGPAMNAAVAEAMGWQPAGGPAPKCPECDTDALRPKCLWEMGASCPRHKVVAEWKARKIPPDYSEDIAAAYRIVTKLSATHTFHLEVEGNSTWAAFHPVDSRRNVEPDDGAYSDGDDEGAAALAISRAALIVVAGRQEGQR